MKRYIAFLPLLAMTSMTAQLSAAPLGLPPVPIPADNPQSEAKIALGNKLFHDTRFSADGKVSCATCHDDSKAFTDRLPVSKGFKDQRGTRNAPTVINAAYMESMFWDGREPDLENQSLQPPINPVEGGLKSHEPILKIVRTDPQYKKAFKGVFGVGGNQLTMDHVAKAIASFERTLVSGNSPFDRYYFGGEKDALSAAEIRGFKVFTGKGRCVSCHVIEQTQALFTDSRFHNIGVGFKRIRDNVNKTAEAFLKEKHASDRENVGDFVDVQVLSRSNISELGRFAVSEDLTEVGAFKTSSLRNIDLTAPYMHDGSIETLEGVVDFYNNGGREKETDPIDDFVSGGIRPLNLSDQEKKDLVRFLKALTSPEYAKTAAK